jgi:outer membrane protein assembly factor BamB
VRALRTLAACAAAGRGGPAPATAAPGPAAVPGRVAPPAQLCLPSPAGAQWAEFGGNWGRADAGTGRAVAAARLTTRWRTPGLDGAIYAQPLVAGGCLLVATENDSVYAFNDADGRLVWRAHLASPVTSGLPCGNIDPSGITGTPVVDAAHDALWVVVLTTSGGRPQHQLVELSLASGRTERRQVLSVPGRNPAAEQQRSALALSGSQVYAAFGGLFGDCDNYAGAVARASTAKASAIAYWSVPTGRGAAIWAPGGPAVLPDGELLVATGNGSAQPGQRFDGSNAVIQLSPALKMTSYFAPPNWAQLNQTDGDLGSTAPVLLPGGRAFEVGKTGTGYLIGTAHLGGVAGEVASAPVCSGGAYGADAVSGSTVYVPCTSGVVAVKAGRADLRVVWRSTSGGGGSPVVAGGRVWEDTRGGSLVELMPSTGRLVATRALPSPVTDFPWLVPVGTTLYASGGDYVVALGGL